MATIGDSISCAVISGDKTQTERQLRIWDDLVRKLEIDAYLRRWHPAATRRETAQTLPRLFSQLDDALDGRIREKPKTLVASINLAYEECRATFQMLTETSGRIGVGPPSPGTGKE